MMAGMTTAPTPPWGTPTAPSSGGRPGGRPGGRSTQPLPTGARPGGPQAEGLGFFLIVEQLTGSGEGMVWRVDPAPQPAGPTRQAAREQAFFLAQTFRSAHPFSPQDRTVYRIDDDTYLVIVTGMTKSFHFRVSVGERMRPV